MRSQLTVLILCIGLLLTTTTQIFAQSVETTPESTPPETPITKPFTPAFVA